MEEVEADSTAEVPSADGNGVQDDPNKACTSCQARKTPMWRNGPEGPKTLCNACGVRLYRQTNKESKEKRAALEAGALPESEEQAVLQELSRRLREATSREAIDAVMREAVVGQLDAEERAELDRRMEEALQGVNLPLGQRRGRRDRKQPQRTSSSQDQDGEGRSVRARRDKSGSAPSRRREDPGGWGDTPRTMMGSLGLGVGRSHGSASPDSYDPPAHILNMYPFDMKKHGQPSVADPRQQYYSIPGFVPSAAPQTPFHLHPQTPLPTACENGYPEDHNGTLAGLGNLGRFPQEIGEFDHFYNSAMEGRFSAANSDDLDSLLPHYPLEQLGGNGAPASPCFVADAAVQQQGRFGQLENGMTTPFRSLNNVKVHAGSDASLSAAVSPSGTPTFTPASAYSSPEYERRVPGAQPRAPLWGSQCGAGGGALPLLTSSQHHDQMYLSIRQPAFRPDSMARNNLEDLSAQCRDDPSTGQSTFGHVSKEERRRNKAARGASRRNNMPELPRSREKQRKGSGSDISTLLNTLSAEAGARRTEATRVTTPHNFEMVDEQIKQSKNIQLGIASNWTATELHLPQTPNTGLVNPLGMSQPEDMHHAGGHIDPMGGYMNYPTHPPSNMPWFSTPYLQPDLAGLMQNSMLPTFPNGLPLSMGENLANDPVVPNNFLPSLSHAPWQGIPGMSGSNSTPSRVDLPEDDDALDAVLSSLGP